MGEFVKILMVMLLAFGAVAEPKEEVIKVEEHKTYELNYTVDTSNSLIKNNKVLGNKLFSINEEDSGTCTKEMVDEIFKDFEYNYDKEFKVHLIDRQGEVWGLSQGNSIIILDNGRNDRYSEYENIILHEFGHMVYNNLRKSDIEEWKEFRQVPKEWNDRLDYDIRPTEIFARDFAYLFGSRYGSGLFAYGNHYTPPYEIEGLKEYIISLGEK